ncbi:MAG: flagellar hook protein FlgE [bacterium]|jgi:flagellar hook protein FlgE
MFTSFSTALSALAAHSTAIDVIGNNLANLNTTGYKTSVVSFRDLVAQTAGAGLGETQVGFGTGTPFTTRVFAQGPIQASIGLLDAAIQGDGFFVLRDNNNAVLYTRCGNFRVDKLGNLMTQTGERVQGWMGDDNGVVNPNGPIGNIVIPVGGSKPPVPTTAISIDLNLDRSTDVGGTFSTPIDVVDTLGYTHVLTVTFTKTENLGEWTYSVTIPGAEVGSTDQAVELVTGTLNFDENGRMVSPDLANQTVHFDITGLTSGAADLSIDWSFYTAAGAPRMTQYNAASGVSENYHNGSPSAELTRVGIADGGLIVAQYSNGEQRVVARLALANMRNPESLIAVGNNNFQASGRTAPAAIGLPESGGRGKIVGGALESSTVDIAREFTNLIVYQRGYQANSRVVTTVDELSQETINLKR